MTATAPARIATDEMLLDAMAIARTVARSMSLRRCNCDADELTGVGYLAVVEALDGFDPLKGAIGPRVSFVVRNRIRDHFRRLDMMSRIQREIAGPDSSVLSLDGLIDHNHPLGCKDKAFGRINARLTVDVLLNQIHPSWRAVMEAYYFGHMTMLEVARSRDTTESFISQVHTKAIARMRDAAKGATV